jgi:hypothetical protein
LALILIFALFLQICKPAFLYILLMKTQAVFALSFR